MKVDDLKERFNDHVLTEVINEENFKVFDFRNKNGEILHYQRWIIDRGTLIVQGDNYDSIYRWNGSGVSLEFLAGCNLGYFSEKCMADKDGRNQKVFESTEAVDFMKRIAANNIFEWEADEFLDDDWNEKYPNFREMSDEEKFEAVKPVIMKRLDLDDWEIDGYFNHENPYECMEFMCKSENEFMFGCDGWEYGYGLEQLTVTPMMHLAALKVANEKYPNAF